jgi:hypothetical protein
VNKKPTNSNIMNKTKFFSAFFIIFASVFYVGCGDDNPTNNNGGTGTPPNIDMKTGSVFTFTFDTLSRVNGVSVRLPQMTSRDTVAGSFPIGSNTAYSIQSRTDSAGVISYDTTLVYYDAGGGKFYQYGITRLINPISNATWDLIADFSLSHGTSWSIPLNPDSIVINGFTIKVVLSAKVVGATSFQTTGLPTREVPCYNVEFKADLNYQSLPLGSIYFDYYIGYNNGTTNSSGIVRLTLRPVNVGIPPSLVISNFGVDKITSTFNVP